VRGYATGSSVRWPARRVQSSIIAQADTLYSYALPTASRTRASAADRVILDYQSPASSPVAARRAGSVILTAQPAAGGGAGWGRREPGQNDTDAAGVLDPDARPEMDTSPGQRTARTRQAAMPGNAAAELTAAAQTAKGAGGSGCPRASTPLPASR
jgi:hypothetical protein